MIQDIEPSRLDNAYKPYNPDEEDPILLFDENGRLCVYDQDGKIRFTTGKEIPTAGSVYLFSVDDVRYFLASEGIQKNLPGYTYKSIRELRNVDQSKEIFAAFTAYHLWRWYMDNRRCGRCGEKNELHPKERALQCSRCGNIIYPRINPAVIVGVINGDSLLITRYRNGYGHNALVAGFTEIGETLEQTVEREVMEEAGIHVKNIRYYKSQPWGMAQDLLAGFYCEVDGKSEIRMDENELKYAEWVARDEIILQPNKLSLTNEMMTVFKEGKEPHVGRNDQK